MILRNINQLAQEETAPAPTEEEIQKMGETGKLPAQPLKIPVMPLIYVGVGILALILLT